MLTAKLWLVVDGSGATVAGRFGYFQGLIERGILIENGVMF